MAPSRKRIGVLALARPTFDVPYAVEVAAAAMVTLQDLDAELLGNGELLFDAETTERALGQFERDHLDALLLLQVSFTDSSMTEAIGARFDAPIILWSFPEERTGGRLRLNSVCGINLAAFALVNAGSDFGYVHRYADDGGAVDDIARLLSENIAQQSSHRRDPKETSVAAAARAAVVASKMAGTTIGVIGDRPVGFDPCGYDPEKLSGVTGVVVERKELEDLFREAGAVEPAAVAAKAHDAHRAVVQIGRRAADKLAGLLGLEKHRQAARERADQRQGMLGHLIGQHARGTGDDDVRGHDRRRQTMVQPGGRRLNPPQAAAADDRRPIDGHLGMPTE
ncbi:MAG: hypothetical protein MUP13_04570, partial [Thermoanaerobaculales bacterium]|nr:hypothetical protein [Thermoanaerobaculales bacterium]